MASSHPSRRWFLRAGLLVPFALAGRHVVRAGQRGLDQFSVPAPPCTDDDLTPAVAPLLPFRPGSPVRTSLREPGLPGTPMVLSGFVIGVKCGPVNQARVDFWQADAAGRVDMPGQRLRGHQFTDAEGRFGLDTIVPGAVAGRARQVGIRVQPPGSRPAFVTTLFFPDDAAHARDAGFNPALVMKKDPRRAGQAFTFNVILDM